MPLWFGYLMMFLTLALVIASAVLFIFIARALLANAAVRGLFSKDEEPDRPPQEDDY